MRHRFRMLAAAPWLLGLTHPALAHAHLKTAVPGAGSSGPAPAQLELAFSERLDLRCSGAQLAGPGGSSPAAGKPELAAGDDSRMVVRLPGGLAPGLYTVTWHALSADSHKTTGSYSFTVTP